MSVVRGLLAIGAFALLGCFGGDPSSPSDTGAGDAGDELDSTSCGFTCADVVDERPIPVRVKSDLDMTCAVVDGCHGGGSGNLGLSAAHDFDRIIGVEAGEMPNMVYVKPFFPFESYLFLKLQCEGGIDGGCMPMGTPTEQWRVDLYHAWIEAGAPTQ